MTTMHLLFGVPPLGGSAFASTRKTWGRILNLFPSCIPIPPEGGTPNMTKTRYKGSAPHAPPTRTRNVLRTPQEKPRPAARSLQGHRGPASDRLDHLDEHQRRDQSGTLFVLQRL